VYNFYFIISLINIYFKLECDVTLWSSIGFSQVVRLYTNLTYNIFSIDVAFVFDEFISNQEWRSLRVGLVLEYVCECDLNHQHTPYIIKMSLGIF